MTSFTSISAAVFLFVTIGTYSVHAQPVTSSVGANNNDDLEVRIPKGKMFSVVCPSSDEEACDIELCRGPDVKWDAATGTCSPSDTNGAFDKVVSGPAILGVKAVIEYKKDFEVQIRGYGLHKLYGPELDGLVDVQFTDSSGTKYVVPGTAKLTKTPGEQYVEIVAQPSSNMEQGTYTTEVWVGDLQIPHKGRTASSVAGLDGTSFDIIQVIFRGLVDAAGTPPENQLTITGAGLFPSKSYKVDATTKQTDSLTGTLSKTVAANDTSHIPFGSVASLGRQLASFDRIVPASATVTALGENGGADLVVGEVDFDLDRCYDGFKNANEADADCGGKDCEKKCVPGQSCRNSGDCEDLSYCDNGLFVCKAGFVSCASAADHFPTERFKEVPVLQSNGQSKQIMCSFASGEDVGGDGSSRDTAGKSCYTIKHGWGRTNPSRGKYWTWMDNKNDPIEVNCDMESCGRDLSEEWNGKDQSGCGGWTLAMKDCSECTHLNYKHTGRWKNPDMGGSWDQDTNDGWAIGPPYKRAPYSDVMIRSLTSPRHNVAWRHPKDGNGMDKSLWETIRNCYHRDDGVIIVPGYGEPTLRQKYLSLYYMHWESHTPQGPFPSGRWNDWDHCTEGGQLDDGTFVRDRRDEFPDWNAMRCQLHGACLASQHWGFFNNDLESNGRHAAGNAWNSWGPLQCNTPHSGQSSPSAGHGGNVIGFGSGTVGISSRRDNHDRNYMTGYRCISGYGFGGDYHGYGGRPHDETMMGHNWGHGNDNVQMSTGQGVFVRNIYD